MSLARLAHQMEVNTGKKPHRSEVWMVSHVKKGGGHLNEHSREMVDALRQKRADALAESSTDSITREMDDTIFTEVVGKEKHGRVRGMGMGPTPRTYFGKESSQHYLSQRASTQDVHELRELVKSMKVQLETEKAESEARLQERVDERVKEKLVEMHAEHQAQMHAEYIARMQELDKTEAARKEKFDKMMAVLNRKLYSQVDSDETQP